VSNADHWEREAENWKAWARTPDHDVFWCYRDAFFELVPTPGRATLEVGCGEGRVSRELGQRGHRVVGIDAAPTLLAAAHEADPAGEYLLADAVALPFDAGSFDLVVAYNSLMDIDDMPRAVEEVARVLEPNGRFCVCVTHPLADAGAFVSREPNSEFVIDGSYLGRRLFEDTFERNGLTMNFRGWAYPLEEYAIAFERAGLAIEALREPALAAGDDPEDRRWRRIPMFLMLRACKSA
jgi:SAM-dependent methyltransferase